MLADAAPVHHHKAADALNTSQQLMGSELMGTVTNDNANDYQLSAPPLIM